MSERIPARGFGPGLRAEGAPVTVRVSGERLIIDGWPGVTAVGRRELRTRRTGGGTVLEWASSAGACALVVGGQRGPAAAALADWLPAPASRPDAATRRWLWATLFLVIGLPLLLVALFLGFRAQIVDAAVALIPVEQEQALGDALWKLQRSGLDLIEGTAANRFVEDVGARLAAAKPSPYTYRFHLADDPGVNAFAMPAGYVVVHRGLIETAATAEEVAGVLAHEIEHVEQRHGLRGVVQAAGLAALWMIVTGDASSGTTGRWLRELAGLQFSREQESAADEGGVARLVAAGIDPRGMTRFFETLAKAQPKMPGALTLLSTHPLSEDRAARLHAMLEDAPAFPALAEDWGAIQRSLPR